MTALVSAETKVEAGALSVLPCGCRALSLLLSQAIIWEVDRELEQPAQELAPLWNASTAGGRLVSHTLVPVP